LTCLLDPSGPHGTRFTVENRPYPRALRSRAPSSPAHLPVVAIAGLRSLANRARSSKPDTDADLDQLPAEATHTVDQYKASIADQPVARVLRISRETPCYPQRPALYQRLRIHLTTTRASRLPDPRVGLRWHAVRSRR